MLAWAEHHKVTMIKFSLWIDKMLLMQTVSHLNNIQENLIFFLQGRLKCHMISIIRMIPNFLASFVWQAGIPPSRDGAMPNTDVPKVSDVAGSAVCCYITAIPFCTIFRVEEPNSPWLARFPVIFSTAWF